MTTKMSLHEAVSYLKQMFANYDEDLISNALKQASICIIRLRHDQHN